MGHFLRKHMVLSITAGVILIAVAVALIVFFTKPSDGVFIKDDWAKVYESDKGNEPVSMRFQESGGPTEVSVKLEYLNAATRTWEQYGEEFTLRIADERAPELPDTQEYRIYARRTEGREGICTFLFSPTVSR